MSGPVSWEDLCCVLAPSYCTISNTPGRESPGIWRDHSRLVHKSLPRGLRQNSDIITLRPCALWSGWQCSSATLFQLIWLGSTLRCNTFLPKLPGLLKICITLINAISVPFLCLFFATKQHHVYVLAPCKYATYLNLHYKHKMGDKLACA